MKNRFSQFFYNKFKQNETYIHELNYLFWECTTRCNLKCLHCGSDCFADSKSPDMPFDDFLNAIKPIRQMHKNPITIVITGGEPLLRNDLPEIGFRLRKEGFGWGIVTNGYAYDNAIHNELLKSGIGAVTLSIDGLEESHNKLRNNPKSFSNAINALELLNQTKQINFDVVTCINQYNVNELYELKKLLIDKNTKAWRIFTIAPIGRAKNNPDLRLNPIQLKELMDYIKLSRTEKQIDIKYSCESYTGEFEKYIRDNGFFCRAGINIASILIDGSISACPNISRNFVQGNIYSDDIIEIWENKFQIMRDRAWTKKGICSKCREYKNCLGGAMHLWEKDSDCIKFCTYDRIKDIV